MKGLGKGRFDEAFTAYGYLELCMVRCWVQRYDMPDMRPHAPTTFFQMLCAWQCTEVVGNGGMDNRFRHTDTMKERPHAGVRVSA